MTDEWIKDKVIVVLGGTSRIGGGCAAERFGWRVRGAITMPPSAQAFDREAGGVVVLANVDPTRVALEIVDAIGNRLAQLRDLEVVNLD